jgi:hypothetical protein
VSIPLSPTDLEKPDVLRSQRREWSIERLGWLIIAVILAVGLLGGFGGGPLAHASRSGQAVNLDFDRVVRHGVPTELRLTVGTGAVVNGRIRVALDWTYLRAVDLLGIHPAPVQSSTSGDRLFLDFAATDGGSNRIIFEVEPHDIGRQQGRIEVGPSRVDLSQFVLP